MCDSDGCSVSVDIESSSNTDNDQGDVSAYIATGLIMLTTYSTDISPRFYCSRWMYACAQSRLQRLSEKIGDCEGFGFILLGIRGVHSPFSVTADRLPGRYLRAGYALIDRNNTGRWTTTIVGS